VAEFGQRGFGRARVIDVGHVLGHSEIQNLHLIPIRDHNVAGFQIAMHDVLLVNVGQRFSDLTGNVDRLVHRQTAASEAAGERFAFEVLHHEVGEIPLAAHVVHTADTRMLEPRDGLRLAIEPLATFGRFIAASGEDLDCHGPVQSHVIGAIDLAHAALAERRHDFVRAEPDAWREHHSRSVRRIAAS
jgi:hypothetical protein